jgi:cation:H+ antiporter
VIVYIGALVVSILIIAKAGDVFLDSACGIARALGVSQAVIALTLIAFATSAPEFFAALTASGLGHAGVAYGDVVGSNIVNITLILALAAIFGMAWIKKVGLEDGLIMLGVGGALLVMSLNGVIGPVEGLLLLAIFTLFLRFVIKRERTGERKLGSSTPKERSLGKLFLLFAAGTAGLIIGSWLLVFGGVGIGQTALEAAGLTRLEAEAVVGFTVIAIGTSIPELATIVISIKKKLVEISVGTIIGSNIFNMALIIGSGSLVGAAAGEFLRADPQGIWFSNPMMLLSMALLVGFMWKRKRLARKSGIALLALYAIYLTGMALFYTF